MAKTTITEAEAELDEISHGRNKAWRLAHRNQVNAAVKLIKFHSSVLAEERRWHVERKLSEFDDFDSMWQLIIQPVTEASKAAAEKLVKALKNHVEVAMKDPNLSPEFRKHGPELLDLRIRAEEATEKIGGKIGRPQKETERKRWAVRVAKILMRYDLSDSGADKFSRLVKLANLIYSGESKETRTFKRLCKEDSFGRLIKKLGSYRPNFQEQK